jgi:hypothetical protein
LDWSCCVWNTLAHKLKAGTELKIERSVKAALFGVGKFRIQDGQRLARFWRRHGGKAAHIFLVEQNHRIALECACTPSGTPTARWKTGVATGLGFFEGFDQERVRLVCGHACTFAMRQAAGPLHTRRLSAPFVSDCGRSKSARPAGHHSFSAGRDCQLSGIPASLSFAARLPICRHGRIPAFDLASEPRDQHVARILRHVNPHSVGHASLRQSAMR